MHLKQMQGVGYEIQWIEKLDDSQVNSSQDQSAIKKTENENPTKPVFLSGRVIVFTSQIL